MFEIKNEDVLFRLSFIERLEEPEERSLDLIMCWLEIEEPCIKLQCQCELAQFELEELRDKLSAFYECLPYKVKPAAIAFVPRIETFTCEVRQVVGADEFGFNFTASPHEDEGWMLKGGIVIDQSYFPRLIRGVDSILSN